MGSHLWRKRACSVFDMFNLKSFGDLQEQASGKHWVMHARQSNQLSGGCRSHGAEQSHLGGADEVMMNSIIYDVDIGKRDQ